MTPSANKPSARPKRTVLARLATLDRFLPVWIIDAMVLGLGRVIPGRYRELDRVTADRRPLVPSPVLNWRVSGPALMFALAWLLLPAYRTGLIIAGLARCIAMVLIWNDLSCGDREAAAVLVTINSVFQILAFGLPGWFYLRALPGWLGLPTTSAQFSVTTIVASVLVFLGIPLAAGFPTRSIGVKTKGTEWYETRFLPKIGPIALYGLLFTIVVLYALRGHTITTEPLDVVRTALLLLAYFALTFGASFALGHRLGPRLRQNRHPGLPRRRQQLRADHCRPDRRRRRYQRTGLLPASSDPSSKSRSWSPSFTLPCGYAVATTPPTPREIAIRALAPRWCARDLTCSRAERRAPRLRRPRPGMSTYHHHRSA